MAQCPYCRAELKDGSSPVRYCTSCGTPHHGDCWDENGGCTVFGCSAAPPEEAKLRVNPADFATGAAAAPAQSGFGVPPPPPSGFAAPPPPPPPGARGAAAGPSFGSYAAPPPPPGYPAYGAPGYAPGYAGATGYYPVPPRSRTGFILLGIFLGAFGAHNFYAGFKGKAIAQLCITLCSVFTLSIVSAIWAIVEVCTVDRDSNHVPMI